MKNLKILTRRPHLDIIKQARNYSKSFLKEIKPEEIIAVIWMSISEFTQFIWIS